jgi:hypothetical protein
MASAYSKVKDKKYGAFHLTKLLVKTRVPVVKVSCTDRKREWKG